MFHLNMYRTPEWIELHIFLVVRLRIFPCRNKSRRRRKGSITGTVLFTIQIIFIRTISIFIAVVLRVFQEHFSIMNRTWPPYNEFNDLLPYVDRHLPLKTILSLSIEERLVFIAGSKRQPMCCSVNRKKADLKPIDIGHHSAQFPTIFCTRTLYNISQYILEQFTYQISTITGGPLRHAIFFDLFLKTREVSADRRTK